MERLIQLIQAYRETDDVEEQIRIATELIELVGPELRAHILRCCRPAMADDVFSKTLAAISEGLDSFHGNTTKEFKGWCYHIVRHKLCDDLRRQANDPAEPTAPEELDRVIDAQTRDALMPAEVRLDLEVTMNMLKRVKPPCYDLLWLHYLQEWDYGEIGLELGLKNDAVRMKIRRCLDLAQSLLGKQP